MDDNVIHGLVSTTARLLKRMEFHEGVDKIAPSYNAILQAVQENHPDNSFLKILAPVEGEINKNQLQILFAQLQIVIEAMAEPDSPVSSVSTEL